MTRRADRLFEIIQLLRGARAPLTASAIAEELEASRSTVYRDIAVLVARHIPIRGEAGTGYVLDRSFDFPPLALTPDETQALVLGVQWVQQHGDPALARAADSVLSKLALSVPEAQRRSVEDPVVGTPPRRHGRAASVDVGRLRSWCHQGWKASLGYVDADGQATKRIIWPFLVGYQDGLQVIIAWCELRGGFRVFRLDRVRELIFLEDPYPESSSVLRARYFESLQG
jgi:predicted DNA-binding transcriptional regulator YafY